MNGETLSAVDIVNLSNGHRRELFKDRELVNIEIGDGWLRFSWAKSKSPFLLTGDYYFISVGSCEDDSFIAFAIHKTIEDNFETVALNDRHPFCKWLLSLGTRDVNGIGKKQIEKATKNVLQLTFDAARFGRRTEKLQEFIRKWNGIPDLSPNLVCPVDSFDPRMFSPPTPKTT